MAASRCSTLDTVRACAVGRLEGPALLQQLQKQWPLPCWLGRVAQWRSSRPCCSPCSPATLRLLLLGLLSVLPRRCCGSLFRSRLLPLQQVDQLLPWRQVGWEAPAALLRRLDLACLQHYRTICIKLYAL